MSQSQTGYLDRCIYTIRHSSHLKELERTAGGKGSFEEKSRWVTGERLLQEAHRLGKHLAVLFAPADVEGGVCWYATLTEIKIGDERDGIDRTRYSFQGLCRLSEELPLDTLIKAIDGRPLSWRYIRPYAVCRTPPVLQELAGP